MKITGYAWIKNPAKTHRGMGTPEHFAGSIVACTEINESGDVLVIKNGMMASFDAIDVLKSFRCSVYGGIVLPPTNDYVKLMQYYLKYMDFCSDGVFNARAFNAMAIAAGIEKGEYRMELVT